MSTYLQHSDDVTPSKSAPIPQSHLILSLLENVPHCLRTVSYSWCTWPEMKLDKFIPGYHVSEVLEGRLHIFLYNCRNLINNLAKAPSIDFVPLSLIFLSKEFISRRFCYGQGWNIKGKLRQSCWYLGKESRFSGEEWLGWSLNSGQSWLPWQDDGWLRAKPQDLGFLGLNHSVATNYLLTLNNLCNVSLSVFPHLQSEHNNNLHTVC